MFILGVEEPSCEANNSPLSDLLKYFKMSDRGS